MVATSPNPGLLSVDHLNRTWRSWFSETRPCTCVNHLLAHLHSAAHEEVVEYQVGFVSSHSDDSSTETLVDEDTLESSHRVCQDE